MELRRKEKKSVKNTLKKKALKLESASNSSFEHKILFFGAVSSEQFRKSQVSKKTISAVIYSSIISKMNLKYPLVELRLNTLNIADSLTISNHNRVLDCNKRYCYVYNKLKAFNINESYIKVFGLIRIIIGIEKIFKIKAMYHYFEKNKNNCKNINI